MSTMFDTEISGVVLIPVKKIRRFPNQPREEFDQKELESLAGSIKEVGLLLPICVRPIPPTDGFEYELIDGERRFIAHQMNAMEYIRAFVVEVKTDFEQYVRSVISNFGKAEHTPLEIAHALQKLIAGFSSNGWGDGTIKKIAVICGKSEPWVYQHMSLLKLCDEVQGLLKEKKINFQICSALSSVTSEKQVEFARHIVQRGLTYKRALHYIRMNRQGHESGRVRKPGDDLSHLKRFLKNLSENSELILDMPFKQFSAMFEKRSEEELSGIISLIAEQAESLNELKGTFEEILQKKQKTVTA